MKWFTHRNEALGEFWTYHAILLTSSRPYSLVEIWIIQEDHFSFNRWQLFISKEVGKWQILSCHNNPSEILEAASSKMIGTRQGFPGKTGLFVSLDHSWLLHFVMLPWLSVWKIIDILRSPLWESLWIPVDQLAEWIFGDFHAISQFSCSQRSSGRILRRVASLNFPGSSLQRQPILGILGFLSNAVHIIIRRSVNWRQYKVHLLK